VTCEEEDAIGNTLHLVDNVKVQVGSGRPFKARTDVNSEIDPSQPVYPIRGSYVRYACDVPHLWPATNTSPAQNTAGKNCRLTDQPHASGSCFRTTFGDWHCFMKDYDNTTTVLKTEIGPPR